MAMPASASTCAARGDSDGVLLDEYLKQEQDDGARGHRLARGAALVQRQGRHDGHLLGRLQRAAGRGARRPPALKAIISLCSTDDRYADDCHYMGGCLLDDISGLGPRSSSPMMGSPPDPAMVGERLARDVAGAAEQQSARSSATG